MIDLFHVFKTFDGLTPALADVSLSVGKGELVFVTGPSGAGKSTLLRLLFAAERPTRGQVVVAGENLERMRPANVPFLRRSIGVVFQDFRLLSTRTVFENVAFPLEVRGDGRAEIERRVYRSLKEVGLVHKAYAMPPTLSGGEQQRVAIARALVGDPSILLADEPTASLDPDNAHEVVKLLETARIRGTTVVIATHDRTLIAAMNARTIALAGGRVVSA
jgi:cell division transport system ATP-binding protein